MRIFPVSSGNDYSGSIRTRLSEAYYSPVTVLKSFIQYLVKTFLTFLCVKLRIFFNISARKRVMVLQMIFLILILAFTSLRMLIMS